MLPLMFALACASPPPAPMEPAAPTRPEGLAPDAVEIHHDAADLRVGDVVVAPMSAVLSDPTDALVPGLSAALAGRASAWVHVAEETPWLLVRKLYVTSREVVPGVQLGTSTRAWPTPRATTSGWGDPTCAPGSASVVGVDRALTIELHQGADGVWATASARFRPVVDTDGVRMPVADLPPRCWQTAQLAPGCAVVDGVAREACEAALAAPPEAPARVEVAGKWGCLLPIAKAPGDLPGWAPELATLLEAWRVASADNVMLVPEAKVPFAALAAVFDAFAARGQPPPTLAIPLVEGNDGPPICDVAIRDADSLDRAFGTWLGAQLAAAQDGAEGGEGLDG